MNRWTFLMFVSLILFTAPTAHAAKPDSADPYAKETPAQRNARMKWFREARFGMFIHWGVYSVPAGTYNGKRIGGIGEWIMNSGKIPCAEYQAYAKQFNPVKYNADAWVRAAKEAGMKYIVITSKHHDGFAMFDSKASDWNIMKASPFGRNPLKELAAACQKHGIRLGFYYSQAQDWNNPGGAAAGGHWDKAQDGSMDDYIKNVAVPQVKEILSNYGNISVLWWDTPYEMTRERAAMLAPLLKLQPGIIHNNRLGGGFNGDTETPEQYIPPTGFGNRDWETCMTMNDTWGYKSYDQNWKSSETLVRNLVDIASKGGNYLLNIGPTNEGLMPAASLQRLKDVGAWMKVNSTAIYATTASPFKKLPWGRCTKQAIKIGTALYLHVFDWPADGRLLVPGLTGDIVGAHLLDQRSLPFEKTPDGLLIHVPREAPSKYSSTVTVHVRSYEVTNPVPGQMSDGSLDLRAADADTHGDQIKYESGDGHDNLGYWVTPTDWASWTFKITKPGRFEVTADIASFGTASFTLKVGNSTLTGTAPNTGSYVQFRQVKLGTVEMSAAGTATLEVRPVVAGWQPINLKVVRLRVVP